MPHHTNHDALRRGELYAELSDLLDQQLQPADLQARLRQLEGAHGREDVVWMLGVLADDLQTVTA